MEKLNKVGNSILWILGVVIFALQSVKLVRYYIFDSNIKMDTHDLVLFICGIGLMALQNVVKDKVKELIKNANPFYKQGVNQNSFGKNGTINPDPDIKPPKEKPE